MFRVLAMLLCALPLCACQTLSHGTTQVVEVRSEPAGALVSIAGFGERATPAFFVLPRNQSFTVRATKEGFKPTQGVLVAQLASDRATPEASVMGVVGSAIDAAAGGSWELKPDKLVLTLEPLPGSAVAKAAATGTIPAQPTPTTVAATPAPATPGIAGAPGPSTPSTDGHVAAPTAAKASAQVALTEQLARLDRLLADGVITAPEHALLRAATLSAAAMAGVPTTP